MTGVEPDGGELTAIFDGRSVTYGFGELDTLVPAYAATIHKSQGSEYPAVVIPVVTQHYPMVQRNLLYTGVTRGKRLVVLVGQRKAVAIAVHGVSGRRRWSKLLEWLRGGTQQVFDRIFVRTENKETSVSIYLVATRERYTDLLLFPVGLKVIPQDTHVRSSAIEPMSKCAISRTRPPYRSGSVVVPAWRLVAFQV